MLSHISAIREQIQTIVNHNDSTPAMESLIHRELTALCSAFPIEKAVATKALPMFIHRYIESSADYLEVYADLAHLARLEPYTHTLLQQAESYFFEPPAIINNSTSAIEQLLAQAYLCHRLLEELNDQVATMRGLILAPIDTTDSNIIIHTLLGDDLANTLDQSILIQLELATPNSVIFNDETVKELTSMRQQQGWDDIKERWPCLNEEVTTLLSLDNFLGPKF